MPKVSCTLNIGVRSEEGAIKFKFLPLSFHKQPSAPSLADAMLGRQSRVAYLPPILPAQFGSILSSTIHCIRTYRMAVRGTGYGTEYIRIWMDAG